MVQIPPGFEQVTDADGVKITKGDGVFFLITPSEDYERAAAFNRLRFRSKVVDTDEISTVSNRVERTNDYTAGTRTFQEFDSLSGGNVVGRPIIEAIPNGEIEQQAREDELAQARANIEASADPLKADFLRWMSFNDSRLRNDSQTKGALITASAIAGRVNDTVQMEIRMTEVPPQGLAGYILLAQVMDDQVAKFTDVTFPPAFPLGSHAPDPVDGPKLDSIAGVDLASAVNGGDTDVLLFTLDIELIARGVTEVILGVATLDDDRGSRIPAARSSGAVTSA